ncbi:DUF6193 family natural product biosynthesis protein [Kitasatospora sp. NPDC001660]
MSGPRPPRPELPDIAAAQERGPAAVVEVTWQAKILAWQWMLHGRTTGSAAGVVPLLRAARAHPRLGRLHPCTSHFILHFSRCTEQPYVSAAPSIEPLPEGRYRLRRRGEVIGHADGPAEALALAATHLPPDLGPVVAHAHELAQ